jgi:GNAT superfamily N-acetyltransferase
MERLSGDDLVVASTSERDMIRSWAEECLLRELYTPTGVVAGNFREPDSIAAMAYAPGIGWGVIHKYGRHLWISVFVREDMRLRGIGTALFRAARKAYTGPRGSIGYSIERAAFFRKALARIEAAQASE